MATKKQQQRATHTQKRIEDAGNVIAFPPMAPRLTGALEASGEKIPAWMSLPPELDRELHALAGKVTTGMSPASLVLAFTDWFMHLSAYPARQQQLAFSAVQAWQRYIAYCNARLNGHDGANCIEPDDSDNRFKDEGWQQLPYAAYAQGFLLTQEWWREATSHLHGVSRHHHDIVQFMTRQWLDMLSPANTPFTNPEVVDTSLREGGQNLWRGMEHWLEDIERFTHNDLPRGVEDYEIGKDIATAEGKVVYRNHLFELIQYAPQTSKVHPEPVLLIPAWIMKYYILDLSPDNSMVNYLTRNGHTVFMISWKNPGRDDAGLSLDDYLKDGALQALEVVQRITGENIHATGYCIGGTLLAIAAAHFARQRRNPLATLSFFTTQIDFEEAGELLMFIDESQLAYLEDVMQQQGYLEKWQLSGAFNMLRSKDLIWSRVVREYLLGEDEQMFDLMAWNADATRLPARMHSEYLRQLYLNNDLAEHRYKVDGSPIHLSDIRQPVFAVATEKDHIAPWPSTFKLHELLNTELTFTLTSGGHNAGVISEPGHKGRSYRIKQRQAHSSYISPQQWQAEAKKKDGSWWPEWQRWLAQHSKEKHAPPPMGGKEYAPLGDAPGEYVHMR